MRPLATQSQIVAPDSTFPYGRIKDDTGLNDGTAVDESVMGDYIQFFEKLFDYSGIVANNLPDNAYTGFQLFEALQMFTNIYPYKRYCANISQAGSAAPTVVVMAGNQIGTIVWTRANTGQYNGALTGAFTDATKCQFFISGTLGVAVIFRVDANNVGLYTFDVSGSPIDGVLSSTAIEIRVNQM